jgi:hypothetical protein
VTARTLHRQMVLDASAVHGQEGSAGEQRYRTLHAVQISGRGWSLPLTTINGARRVALCVKSLARRAHLQLSARVRGGRVQSIGGAVRGRGSEHGETEDARESSWAGRDLWLWAERAVCGGEGASSSQVRAAWTLNGTEGAGETAKCVAGGLPDGGGRWYRRLCEK